MGWIRDPEKTYPGSRIQVSKSTGSWIRIRNTAWMSVLLSSAPIPVFMMDFVNSFGKHIFRSSTSRMFTASLKDALLGKDKLRIVGPWFLICCHDWVSSKVREMWLVKGVVQQILFFIHVAKTSVMSSPFQEPRGQWLLLNWGGVFSKGFYLFTSKRSIVCKAVRFCSGQRPIIPTLVNILF